MFRLRVDEFRVFYDISGQELQILAIVTKNRLEHHPAFLQRVSLICLLVVLGWTWFPSRATAQQSALDFSRLEATVRAELEATGTPGAAVAVVVGDSVVFAKGFGVADIETGAGVTPQTLFRIASTTKMLTSTAVVALAERGVLSLDVPVGQYVQGLSPRLGQITLHQLLSHTSGLRDGSSYYGPQDDEALAQFVSSWTDDYLIAEPGEIYSYSNLGLILAGRVLEAVLGRPYADAMDEVLFKPLGMRRTTLRPTMAMTYPLAQGHDLAAGASALAVVRPYSQDVRYAPAGGVFTNVADFARFTIAFLNGGVIDGAQVLPPAVSGTLSTPRVDVPTTNPADRPQHGYGMNVRVHRGVRVVQHGGLRIGFGSLVRMVPDHRVAVIILTNRSNGLLLKSFETATELAVPLEPAPPPPQRTPVAMSPSDLSESAGTYQNGPDYLTIELIVENGKLFLRQVGQEGKAEVLKTGPDSFAGAGTEFLLLRGRTSGAAYMHIAGHALRKLPD
jgi:CubicO group peptidase (beta-lactamase class C family)